MTGDRLTQVLDDLARLGDRLEQALAAASDDDWRRETPSPGWDVATQVGHLAWTDEVATLAARAHVDTQAWDDVVLQAIEDPDGFVDVSALRAGAGAPEALLARWRDSRAGLRAALEELPEGVRLPWFGPPMSATSMATARYMETWAHSQDVFDTLGVLVEHTRGLRHVCHLGVRTRDFSFRNRDEEPPTEEFRVELIAPDGDSWTWGPEDAVQVVRGSAVDFALLVTQRRHPLELDVTATGDDARRWLSVAQAFAGPAGGGREAGDAR